MRKLTLGSLFDGVGGFLLAAERNGITPLWASEVDKNCIAVTKKHFPSVTHVGDITKLCGADLPPVDIITGGSPCQDLSVASITRKGLDGDRSGLFREMIRIITEMRLSDEKSNGGSNELIRPRYAVWENVVGAFSSNSGEDFRQVLEAFARIADKSAEIPKPPGGKWTTAGEWVEANYSLSWRVVDAQFWGVPQRRRRIALVADFGGSNAPEILFERQGD